MRLYKREGSPLWWYDFSVGGVRKRGSTERRVKKEALAVAEELRRRLLDRQQLGGGKEELTVREALFDHYLGEKTGHKRFRDYETICKKLVGETLDVKGLKGSLPFHELTTSMLRKYRAGRVGSPVMTQKYASLQVDRASSAAASLLDQLHGDSRSL